jgi:nitrite reductase/ring-hydroxylating ferredoxin subunit
MLAQLHLAGVYRRRVHASPARIWENVFDWEHLPALHETTFRSVALEERRGDDWTVRFGEAGGGAETRIRLDSDRAAGGYRVTTLDGSGERSEIRVSLTPVETHVTDVEVQYHVPEGDPGRLARIGEGFVALYARLWDEDEAMMRLREQRLRGRGSRSPAEPVRLGRAETMGAPLPLLVEFGGSPVRVERLDGELIAFSAVCPHWLGPLEDAPLEDGAVRCPWHGWRFDVRTGENLDGRPCRLAPAPRVSVEDGEVWLRP